MTVMAEGLLEGEVEAITRKLIDKALEGDNAALIRLCLERLIPPKRGRTVRFELGAHSASLYPSFLIARVSRIHTYDDLLRA